MAPSCALPRGWRLRQREAGRGQGLHAAYELSHLRRGDTTDVLLDYVGYDLKALRSAYKVKIAAAGVDAATAERLQAALETGLTGYTYLQESLGE